MNDPTVSADFYHDDKATLGDRITGAREAAELSQGQLAEQLGVKLSTLRKWEEDQSEPRANRLQMMAGLLNVSLRWLLTGQGEDLVPSGVAVSAEEVAALKARLYEALDMLERMEERLENA
ncbi:MAG: helix-turn-helix transcriptional regulator [Pseudomonadota bacterium]